MLLKLDFYASVKNKTLGMCPDFVECWVCIWLVYYSFIIGLLDIGKVFKVDEKIKMFPHCFLCHKAECPKRGSLILVA